MKVNIANNAAASIDRLDRHERGRVLQLLERFQHGDLSDLVLVGTSHPDVDLFVAPTGNLRMFVDVDREDDKVLVVGLERRQGGRFETVAQEPAPAVVD